jgi:hypothetical protein
MELSYSLYSYDNSTVPILSQEITNDGVYTVNAQATALDMSNFSMTFFPPWWG